MKKLSQTLSNQIQKIWTNSAKFYYKNDDLSDWKTVVLLISKLFQPMVKLNHKQTSNFLILNLIQLKNLSPFINGNLKFILHFFFLVKPPIYLIYLLLDFILFNSFLVQGSFSLAWYFFQNFLLFFIRHIQSHISRGASKLFISLHCEIIFKNTSFVWLGSE